MGTPTALSCAAAGGKGNAAVVDAIRGADRHAADVLPVIEDVCIARIASLKGIAAEPSNF